MTEACKCGTFAVGRCADCSAPACGRHSRLVHDRFLCSEHVAVELRGMRLYLLMTAVAMAFIALVAYVSSLFGS